MKGYKERRWDMPDQGAKAVNRNRFDKAVRDEREDRSLDDALPDPYEGIRAAYGGAGRIAPGNTATITYNGESVSGEVYKIAKAKNGLEQIGVEMRVLAEVADKSSGLMEQFRTSFDGAMKKAAEAQLRPAFEEMLLGDRVSRPIETERWSGWTWTATADDAERIKAERKAEEQEYDAALARRLGYVVSDREALALDEQAARLKNNASAFMTEDVMNLLGGTAQWQMGSIRSAQAGLLVSDDLYAGKANALDAPQKDDIPNPFRRVALIEIDEADD